MRTDLLKTQPLALYQPERIDALLAGPLVKPRTIARGLNTSTEIIPLIGFISQHDSSFGTSLDQFNAQLLDATNDSTIDRVLIVIDSPGGSVYVVQETAAMLRAARTRKPIIAIANSLAASAAYWIGSQASEFYCTPSGEVGSIGVFQIHQDISTALRKAGLKPTIISAGKYKVEGNPYQSLGKGTQDFMQSRIDDYFNQFIQDVSAGRGVDPSKVRKDFGQGRLIGAKDAATLGMIDGVMTLQAVLKGRQSLTSRRAAQIASTTIAKARLKLLQ